MAQPMLTAGLGLKPEHYAAAMAARTPGLWFEVHAENHMVEGGPRVGWLRALRDHHPVSLHGVALSLAGAERPDAAHLQRLARLVRDIEPALVSEHLAWSTWDGVCIPDLLPFVRDGAALRRIAEHIDHTQQALGRSIAIENPSHYLRLPGHDWDEIDFLAELVRRTGCGLLLDINNVHVSACNLGFDAGAWVDRFPADAVQEIHLAGHSQDAHDAHDAQDAQNAHGGRALLIDSHDTPVAPAVWQLYQRFVLRAGPRPTLIERDADVPGFDALMAERSHAAEILSTRTTLTAPEEAPA